LVPAQAGKLTVGLASHWRCVTYNSGISTYRLTSLRQEDEHSAYAPVEYGTLYLFYMVVTSEALAAGRVSVQ